MKNMEQLNVHLKNIHQESDSDRIDRLTDTFKSALVEESIKSASVKNMISYSCTECGLLFENGEQLNCHNQEHHACGIIQEPISASNSAKKTEIIDKPNTKEKSKIICELWDKIFLNRNQKSSHKLLVHTVKTEYIKC